MPIISRLPQLMADKKVRNINRLSAETGVATPTLYRLYDGTNTRVDYNTLELLCRFFKCQVGDLLVYQEESQ